MRKISTWLSVIIMSALVLSGCASVPGLLTVGGQVKGSSPAVQAATAQPSIPAATSAPSNLPQSTTSIAPDALMSAFEGTLQQIYQNVNPSVVNIQVVIGSGVVSQTTPGLPFGTPNNPNQNAPSGMALGSGFVWDKNGDIVTNNHVVENATKVDVIFSDGLDVPAKVIGTDVNSDLAVVKVDVPAERLIPVTVADSTQVKVGQVAIAIGNPFGLQGSMSEGIISGLGRKLDVNGNNADSTVGTYEIPDIIQTDAPINPGNSGGVLVNDQGQVLGVTAAIESSSNSNSGIGFVIPSVIVKKVVPSLISTGSFQHPYLGLSGTTITPELAQPMGLNSDQRGVLVETVTAGGPAAAAGLQPSSKPVSIDGNQVNVGGDVIVSVNGALVKTFEDLVTYLARNTDVNQKITLGVLRSGKPINVDVTLGARPGSSPSANTQPTQSAAPASTGSYLGVNGVTLVSEINQAMNLPQNQQGVLVVLVQQGGPADNAGVQGGGSQNVTINGNSISIGGDVITAVDGKVTNTIQQLRTILSQDQPGQQVSLAILRGGKTMQLNVKLGTPPTQ